MTPIGRLSSGATLSYGESAFAFFADGEVVSLDEVRAMDASGLITWRFLEHRDWMWRIDGCALDRKAREAGVLLGLQDGSLSEKDRQIKEHVRKDNSYLHGHIVDADAQAEERLRAAELEREAKRAEEDAAREAAAAKEAAEAPIRERREKQAREARERTFAQSKVGRVAWKARERLGRRATKAQAKKESGAQGSQSSDTGK